VQDFPPDVAAAVDETWARFEGVFADRLDCMDPVWLVLVDDVADGDALYLPDGQTIHIQIPTSPARFSESLVHELAHHLDATCDEQKDLRQDFLHAQAFPSERSGIQATNGRPRRRSISQKRLSCWSTATACCTTISSRSLRRR
jgi:hypothetical protein